MPGPSAVQSSQTPPSIEGGKTQNIRQSKDANPPFVSDNAQTERDLSNRKAIIELDIKRAKSKRNTAIGSFFRALLAIAISASVAVLCFMAIATIYIILGVVFTIFAIACIVDAGICAYNAVQHHREVKKLQEQEAQIAEKSSGGD